MTSATNLTNAFGLSQYDGQTSFFGNYTPLGQGVGYGVVIGLGTPHAQNSLIWPCTQPI